MKNRVCPRCGKNLLEDWKGGGRYCFACGFRESSITEWCGGGV